MCLHVSRHRTKNVTYYLLIKCRTLSVFIQAERDNIGSDTSFKKIYFNTMTEN